MNSDEACRIKAVYDERERTYRRDLSNPGWRRLFAERDAALAAILRDQFKRPLSELRVLDVGCGYGTLLRWFQDQGADPAALVGVDLLAHRVKAARERYPELTFIEANAEQLPVPDSYFDLVLAFTVFSSILNDDVARNVAASISRAVASGGAVVWYDIRFPNPWNRHVRALPKSRIRKLFPYFRLELRSLTLLPPVAFRLGGMSETLYGPLAAIPLFRSHYLGLVWPPKLDDGLHLSRQVL